MLKESKFIKGIIILVDIVEKKIGLEELDVVLV
jgi:hypothetical protein